jgi:hypothetical protein
METETWRTLIPLLAPLVILELALMVAALWDLAHRERVRGGKKWVWAVVAAVFNIIGPLVYFVYGRED